MDLKATVVGYVKKPDDGDIHIQIEERFWNATLEMDKFSHVIVLWWITGHDTPHDRSNLQGIPPVEGSALSGIFATRSPRRPTPIGLSICKIGKLDQKNLRIHLDQIDALDGTPVVDIKPYIPFSDKVDRARVPEWFMKNTPRYTDTPLD